MAEQTEVGILAFGAYLPRLRLSRKAVADANAWFAAGLKGLAKGERSMANWDEDSITMAVEASRDCLTSHKAEDVRSLYFASTTHPFKDRQNAGVIGTALEPRAEPSRHRRRRLAARPAPRR